VGDTVARLGGDEFAVLLSDADHRAAEIVSARALDALRRSPARHHGGTFSIGVCTCTAPPASVGESIEAADELMYQAKRSGKDKVVMAAASPAP
jgi:diguanylate cyclase (GGDEF)-like protein